MCRKSGRKWSTKKCGRCGDPHTGFLGKLDKDNVEYVVCTTNKRMNVLPKDKTVRDACFGTLWYQEKDDKINGCKNREDGS